MIIRFDAANQFLKIGKLIYSNTGVKRDVMFSCTPAKYLFWRFWWSQ